MLYLYNSLVNVWAYNGNIFSSYKDNGYKIIKSTAFAANDEFAFFVNEGKLLVLDYTSGETTEFPISENVTSLIAVGKDVYAVSDGRISKVDLKIKLLSKQPFPPSETLRRTADSSRQSPTATTRLLHTTRL